MFSLKRNFLTQTQGKINKNLILEIKGHGTSYNQ